MFCCYSRSKPPGATPGGRSEAPIPIPKPDSAALDSNSSLDKTETEEVDSETESTRDPHSTTDLAQSGKLDQPATSTVGELPSSGQPALDRRPSNPNSTLTRMNSQPVGSTVNPSLGALGRQGSGSIPKPVLRRGSSYMDGQKPVSAQFKHVSWVGLGDSDSGESDDDEGKGVQMQVKVAPAPTLAQITEASPASSSASLSMSNPTLGSTTTTTLPVPSNSKPTSGASSAVHDSPPSSGEIPSSRLSLNSSGILETPPSSDPNMSAALRQQEEAKAAAAKAAEQKRLEEERKLQEAREREQREREKEKERELAAQKEKELKAKQQQQAAQQAQHQAQAAQQQQFPKVEEKRASVSEKMRVEYSPGRIEDKYDITETLLGQGAFGKVVVGIDHKYQREYAIKIIPHSNMILKDAEFMEEVEVLSRMKHPNIIELVDKYTTPQNLFLVMELASGGELFDRIIEEKRLDEREVRWVASQLFEAIAYLHSQGICHRDLKPENILFKDNTRMSAIKVTDFGFAKHLNTGQQLMRASAKRGTMGYAAPEIFSGKPYGEKCDVWSAGIICYIMLSGVPPFCELPPLEQALRIPFWKHANKMKKIPTTPVEFPNEFWKGISDNAKHFLQQALKVDPLQRARAVDLCKHPWLKQTGKMNATSTFVASGPLPVFTGKSSLR